MHPPSRHGYRMFLGWVHCALARARFGIAGPGVGYLTF